MKREKPVEFNIYPRPGRRLHFRVQVFITKRAMWRYCQKNCASPIGRRTTAVCHSFYQIEFMKKQKRINPRMGEIHFYRRGLGSNVIAHECTHAAIFYLRRILRKDRLEFGRASQTMGRASPFIDGPEELLCIFVGNLFRECNRKLHLVGIWK